MEEREIHSLQISIGGQKYDIRTSGDIGRLTEIAHDADVKVSALLKGRLTYQQALALTMLDYAETAADANDTAVRLKEEFGDYLKNLEDAQLECERLKRENERLRKRIIGNN